MDTSDKLHFTCFYVRKNIFLKDCKLQEGVVEEVKYFKIEDLAYLETEGLEWLENFKKVM